jgi:anthranilate synthase component 1
MAIGTDIVLQNLDVSATTTTNDGTGITVSGTDHLVSTVSGELAEGRDALDALVAAFPAGTLSGAPKIRAMQIVDELERHPRGLYGGALGYVDLAGGLDFCIAIRTLWMRAGRATVQAGAGIVADSDPVAEQRETEHKAMAMRGALRLAAELRLGS